MALPFPGRKLAKVRTQEPSLARCPENAPQASDRLPRSAGDCGHAPPCLLKQCLLDIATNFPQDQWLFSWSPTAVLCLNPRHPEVNSAASECSPLRAFAFLLSKFLFCLCVVCQLAKGIREQLRAPVSSWQGQGGGRGTECWRLRS